MVAIAKPHVLVLFHSLNFKCRVSVKSRMYSFITEYIHKSEKAKGINKTTVDGGLNCFV